MQVYKKIIAAIDFSDHTDVVLQRAQLLAKHEGAALLVLHVVDYYWPTDMDYVIPPTDEMEEKLIEEAHARLHTVLKDAGFTHAETIIETGRPKQEILRVVEREQPDLIVVGAHGHHGIAGLLGSTSDRVSHRAACDVLIVH